MPIASTRKFLSPAAFASLAFNPRAGLVGNKTIFNTACHGDGVNPMQNLDYITPADWSATPGRKCVFGYDTDAATGRPAGKYTVGGANQAPRFFLIPPEAFAQDPNSIKQLSQLWLVVDTSQGCEYIGSIGATADGLTYQCDACNFLRPGGICPSSDGAKRLVLPNNKGTILDPVKNGGAYGFLGFPLVIFKKDFSLYYTGTAGYAPLRTYFEATVETLLPNVQVKTTAEMTSREIGEVTTAFDSLLGSTNPTAYIASLEHQATPLTPARVILKRRDQAEFVYSARPGSVLSSIFMRIVPLYDQRNKQFLETNFCLTINGKETCLTGVEDFAHCAYFTTCATTYSWLAPEGDGGYVAMRYFPSWTAPVIRDGKIIVRLLIPDFGTVLDTEIRVNVRDVDSSLASDDRWFQDRQNRLPD